MKMTLGERVRKALEGPPKRTQRALAEACGIHPVSVNDWVHDRTQSVEGANLLKAAKFLEVSPAWLATGLGPMRGPAATSTESDADVLTIARFDIQVAAGSNNVVASEVRIDGLTFRRDFLRSCGIRHEDDGVVVGVKGRSMWPTIPPGSVVLVNKRSRTPIHKNIFVFRDESEEGAVVKRVLKEQGNWIARSDGNEDGSFPDFPFHDGHQLIGRAVWMGTKL